MYSKHIRLEIKYNNFIEIIDLEVIQRPLMFSIKQNSDSVVGALSESSLVRFAFYWF